MNNTIAQKRWFRLIPVAFITYSLAYLDRANFGFAAAGEMAKDLHITAATSSLLGSLFFLGYFFFKFRAHTMRRIKVQRSLSLLVADIMGCVSSSNRIGQQHFPADDHSFYAGRCGKCSNAFHDYFIKQVVYKTGTFESQYIFNTR
jgi:hypothetical protein